MTADISACIVFHAEGEYAIAAIDSFAAMLAAARQAGLSVEGIALVDRPDTVTRGVVEAHADCFDRIEWCDFGDLSLTRNFGVSISKGTFLAFFDGDDLWGFDWLRLAYLAATCSPEAASRIWHPSHLVYFDAQDFDRRNGPQPPRSFVGKHTPSADPAFRLRNLAFENTWTAHILCHRDIHLAHPYGLIDRAHGYGVEDWAFNLATVEAGIVHDIVPDTLHIIRVGRPDSLSQENVARGRLPRLGSRTSYLHKA